MKDNNVPAPVPLPGRRGRAQRLSQSLVTFKALYSLWVETLKDMDLVEDERVSAYFLAASGHMAVAQSELTKELADAALEAALATPRPLSGGK